MKGAAKRGCGGDGNGDSNGSSNNKQCGVQNGLRTSRHCKDLQAKMEHPFVRVLGGPN
jgi:hypothetical protein